MSDFFERALQEAARYGSDPWIFVRELLQNARDAGATEVAFAVADIDGSSFVRCQDDGAGMGFEHAQRFLFRLYASSKEGNGKEAGRFGVGFWSILRFEPRLIRIRSWPRSGEGPWEVVLAKGLGEATRRTPTDMKGPGTEILLERPGPTKKLAQQVADAAWRNGRFLERKDAPGMALRISVNGTVLNAPFQLPAPSASFRAGGDRGVVALGPTPSVELFSKGLRVRSATVLEDLLAADDPSARRVFPELANGLAPRALLESTQLELLLSRSDARDDRALRRLVRTARHELGRLIARQVELARPTSAWSRALEWTTTSVWGSALLGLCVAGGLLTAHHVLRERGIGVFAPPPAVSRPIAQAAPAYRDLSSYEGPRTNLLNARAGPAVPIRYRPEDTERLYLGALRILDFDRDGTPFLGDTAGVTGDVAKGPRYTGAPCERGCVELEVPIDARPGAVRLPVPLGHALDPDSVRDPRGNQAVVFESSAGEPMVHVVQPVKGLVLRYRTGPAPGAIQPPRQGRPLPRELEALALRLRPLPPEERVEQALAFVQRAIGYSTSPEAVESLAALTARRVPFLERALRVGAGDCDVQNGVLTLLLQELGIPARMVAGYVGRGGRVQPMMHAWVEYLAPDGTVKLLDASTSSLDANPAPTFALAPSAASVPEAPAADPSAFASPTTPAAGAAPAIAPASNPETTGPIPRDPTEPASPEPIRPPPADAEAPAAAPETPTQTFPTLTSALKVLTVVAVGLIGIGLLVALLQRLLGGRSKGTDVVTRVDPRQDLTQLLLGVLQHPESFPYVPELYERRLLARLRGRAASLAQVLRSARRRLLYVARQEVPLTRRVRLRRGLVLDGKQPEAAAVARALGAVDLEEWRAILERTETSPLLDRLNAFLERQGEPWKVATAPDLPPLRVLELPDFRFVVLSPSAPWLVAASRLATREPDRALFTLLDELAERIGLDDPARARLVSPLALAAVQEAASR